MSLRIALTLAAALVLVAGPAFAKDEPRPDALPDLLKKLHGDEVVIEGNLNDVPLFEHLQRLTKQYAVSFVINEEVFRAEGVNDIKDAKPNLAATQFRGLTLHDALTKVLSSMGATYIIKGKMIEIVTPGYAAKAAKAAVTEGEDGRRRLVEPIVSAVFKEKPLNEAVAQLAERYDLTVVVAPQAGDARTGFVSARLLNIPADKALELLVVQSDLRVVRKGTAFLITSREHAENMFQEQLERERAKIELEKFRSAPPPRPGPQPELKLIPQTGGTFDLKLNLVPPIKP